MHEPIFHKYMVVSFYSQLIFCIVWVSVFQRLPRFSSLTSKYFKVKSWRPVNSRPLTTPLSVSSLAKTSLLLTCRQSAHFRLVRYWRDLSNTRQWTNLEYCTEMPLTNHLCHWCHHQNQRTADSDPPGILGHTEKLHTPTNTINSSPSFTITHHHHHHLAVWQ